jgi:hypothetical protein
MMNWVNLLNRKTKAAILLLCVFFMMVNTCPFRSILISVFTPSVELSKKSNTSEALVYDNLRCSESNIAKVIPLDLSNSNGNSLPLPLFLTVISLYLALSKLSLIYQPLKKERKLVLIASIPLFLQHQSIII